MNKERLEWIMSGLNQHKLTKNEDQFVKTALEDFDQKHTLTEHQEEKIESLYKEKSKLILVKDYSDFKKSSPKKPRARRPPKVVF
jgi:hypothetical protein